MTDENKPPFHIVSRMTNKHIGPFTTYSDALLACNIATPDWSTGKILDAQEMAERINSLIEQRNRGDL